MLHAQKQRLMILDFIKELFRIAERNGKSIDRIKLTAEIGMKFGSTKRKIFEYIDDLKGAGVIDEDKYGLWAGKQIKEEIKIELESLDGIPI